MKTTYIFRDGQMVDKSKVKERPKPSLSMVLDRFELKNPYKSPLGTGFISTYRQRRDDLERGGCREVDPSEMKHMRGYTNPTFAHKRGLQLREDLHG